MITGSWPNRGRLLAGVGAVILSVLLFLPAAASDRRSGQEQALFWLLGLTLGQEHHGERIDINSATVEELRAVPGIDPRQARRILAERPYEKLLDLTRAGLSPIAIKRVARFVAVDSDWPSALPNPAAPRLR